MKCSNCGVLKKSSGKCLMCGAGEDVVVMKKTSVSDIKKLMDKADKVFGDYIKERDKIAGVYKCITCNKIFDRKKIQCGHFHSRKYLAIRWDEFNCAAQCVSCNIFNQGMQYEFGIALEKKYGKEALDKLAQRKNNKFKKEKFTLELIIKEYEQKLNQLLKK